MLLLTKIKLDVSVTISVLELMATPTLACVSADALFIPSFLMAKIRLYLIAMTFMVIDQNKKLDY